MLKSYRDLPSGVLVLCLGAFVNRAGAMVMPFLALYLTQSRGSPTSVATSIMGVFGVGSVFASIAGGWLADRFGRKPVMIASLIGAAGTIQIVPRLDTELGVMLAVLAFSLAGEAYRPAASAMLGDLTTPESRPRAYALFYVAINLGFTAGAAVGGALAAHSYDLLFLVEGVTALAYALMIALFLAETRPEVSLTPSETASKGALVHILQNRIFLLFLLANLLIGLMFNQAFTTLPLSMAAVGIPPQTYGQVMAVNGVLIVLVQLPLASRLSRADRGVWMVVAALFLTLGFGLTGAFDTPVTIAGCVILWTIGEMILASLNQTVVGDLAPVEFRARYFGTFALSMGLAMSIGPPLGGYVFERWGAPALWGCVAMVGLAAAAILASIRGPIAQPASLPENAPAVSASLPAA